MEYSTTDFYCTNTTNPHTSGTGIGLQILMEQTCLRQAPFTERGFGG